jgi:hypothetical protein
MKQRNSARCRSYYWGQNQRDRIDVVRSLISDLMSKSVLDHFDTV